MDATLDAPNQLLMLVTLRRMNSIQRNWMNSQVLILGFRLVIGQIVLTSTRLSNTSHPHQEFGYRYMPQSSDILNLVSYERNNEKNSMQFRLYSALKLFTAYIEPCLLWSFGYCSHTSHAWFCFTQAKDIYGKLILQICFASSKLIKRSWEIVKKILVCYLSCR